jgi:amidase
MSTKPESCPDEAGDSLSRRSFLTAAGASVAAVMAAGVRPTAGFLHGAGADSPPKELYYQSATGLAEMIRSKKVSSEDVVRANIGRIKAVNPKINAVVFLAEEQALAEAKKADQAIQEGKADWRRQPLLGVPVSIKDNLETKGIPTTAGAPKLKDNRPTEDATVVRKLKEAGAILLAKTNLPFLAGAYDTSNLLFGQTNNPYDLGCSPGGSCGGEGALIAAGGSPLGIGTDSSGSIRVPSHFCGVAGLCPSWGRVSTAGFIPFGQNNGPFFNLIGPMARRVEDLTLALSLLAGQDHRDPFTFPLSPLGQQRPKVKDLRIAFFTDTQDVHPTDSIQVTVERAAKVLEKAGSKVDERRPSVFAEAKGHDLILALLEPDLLATPKNQKEYGAEKDPLINEGVDRFSASIKQIPAGRFNDLKNAWPRVQREFLAFMYQHQLDALVCPVCARPAMKHGTTWMRCQEGAFFFTEMFSLVGSCPMGVVRCGTSPEGLPIGVHVVGAPWRDDVVLEILSFLEKEFGGWTPPPL